MTKLIANATRADVDLVNSIQPPTAGVNAGGGVHVSIPDNWADLIAQGVDVPGCTYARIEADGSLIVSDVVQAELAVPAIVQDLPVASVNDLNTKLATAVAQPVNTQPVVFTGQQVTEVT